jgi:hypothetical protein
VATIGYSVLMKRDMEQPKLNHYLSIGEAMRQTSRIHQTRFYALVCVCVSVVTLAYPKDQDSPEHRGQGRYAIKAGPYYTRPYELHPETERILEKYQAVISSGSAQKDAATTTGSQEIFTDDDQDENHSYWPIARLISAGAIVVLGLLYANQKRRQPLEYFPDGSDSDGDLLEGGSPEQSGVDWKGAQRSESAAGYADHGAGAFTPEQYLYWYKEQ